MRRTKEMVSTESQRLNTTNITKVSQPTRETTEVMIPLRPPLTASIIPNPAKPNIPKVEGNDRTYADIESNSAC